MKRYFSARYDEAEYADGQYVLHSDHEAALREAVAKERVRVMLAIADEWCGYDDMAETLRERARGAA